VLTKRVHHVVDLETDPSCTSEFRRHAAERGVRSFVAVPMLRGADPLGAIVVSRARPGAFSSGEIALLQTFADQAVIAVENARLLAELQARNAELTESLARQTATSEVLKVISQSLTDVQPVFDTIVQSARRLLSGHGASLSRVVGDTLELAALTTKSEADDAAMRRD
jgi:two-component system NtrC family sensor kinase